MLQMISRLLCDTFGLEVLASKHYHLGMNLCLDDFTVICLELTSKLEYSDHNNLMSVTEWPRLKTDNVGLAPCTIACSDIQLHYASIMLRASVVSDGLKSSL